MPTGRPSRHRPERHGEEYGQPSGQKRAFRRRYLWAALAIPALAALGFYLAQGAPMSRAPVSAAPTAAPGSVSAARSPDPCGSPATMTDAAGTAGGAGAPCSLGSARVAKMPLAVAGAVAPSGTKHTSTPSAPSSHPATQAAHAPSSSSSSSTASSQQGTPAGQVLALINQARSQAGLPDLTFSTGLDDSASAHNLKMADGCGLSHQCPGEPAIGARETAAGVSWTSAGENIGEAGPEADTTSAIAQAAVGLTQDMLNEKPPDDGHRLNILSTSFHHIGIAVYRDSSGTVWMTQDFSS
jgi:uncharacterized protein YkwD